MNLNRKKLLHVVGFAVVLLLMFGASMLFPRDQVEAWVSNAGAWGPVVYILLMLLSYVIAPLSGTPILFVGFYLFGSNAIFFAAVSEVVSIMVNFYIARRWGRGVVAKLVGAKGMERIDRLTHRYGLGMLWIARVFLGVFHEFVSYAAGFTNIKFSHYVFVSLIGIIPGTAIWYFFSSQTESPIVFTMITFGLAAIFSLVAVFIQRWSSTDESNHRTSL